MSRSSKWKLEQTKTKVVFRLHFHTTHVPLTGWDKLFISLISADTGKPTAKTSKANVRNGTCKWPDPIYETTRLLQNSQTKQYDDKLYKIIVAMGSSRSSILGETTINLADFVDPLNPSVVPLPLHGCSYGTVLHVTVQLLTSKTGFREFERQRELREMALDPGINVHSNNSTHNIYSLDEVSGRTKFKLDSAELSSIDEDASVNEEYADSGVGFDGSPSTSGSLCTEKPESFSRHDIENVRSTMSGDRHALPHAIGGDTSHHQNVFNEGASSSGLLTENSTAHNSAAIIEENNKLRESLAVAEASSLSLKMEVDSLQHLADKLGAETEKFSHLLAAEISSFDDLTKEVSILKSDYFKLKDDMSKLKDFKLGHTRKSDGQLGFVDKNMKVQFQRGVAIVDGKIRGLLSNIFHGHLNGNTKSICLELEGLLNFLLDFKLEDVVLSETNGVNEIRKLTASNHDEFSSNNLLGSDLCRPEILPHLILNAPESVLVDSAATLEAMKCQILDLARDLDEAKVEKEVLAKKMDQMECYYEGLVQELEETQKRLLGELQHLKKERSNSLPALSAVEAENELLHQQINQQMQRFVEERQNLEDLNKELARRATISEAALRRARLNYTVAVGNLQKDLELLSSQVVSMFETNESLIKKALPLQHERGIHNPEDDDNVEKLPPFKKKSLGGDILFEDLKRSFCLQGELYKKIEEELIRVYSVSLDLDIYSKALQGSLRDADVLVGIMKEKLAELEEELKLSTASQNQLMLRLQQAKEDIHALNDFKSSSISQCADLSQQNQLLEKKLMSISEENYILVQKLNDQENVVMENVTYKNKCEALLAENAELSLQLKHELLDKERLANDISVLEGNIASLRIECDNLLHLKENHEEKVSCTENKLSACLSENAELSLQLKHEVLEKEKLVDDMSILDGKIVTLKSESDKLLHLKESLEEKISIAENKLAACLVENAELSLQLKHEVLEREKLANDISMLEGNIATLKLESNKLLHLKENHEENISLTENKLSACLIENGELALQLKHEVLEKEKLVNDASILDGKILTLTSECDKLLHLKQTLEEKISFTENKLTACLIENDELSLKLKHEVLEKEKVANDISMLEGNIATLKLESDKLLHLKENHEETISLTENKLSACLNENAELYLQLKNEVLEKEKLANYISTLEGEVVTLGSESDKLLHLKESLEEKISIAENKLAACLVENDELSLQLKHEVLQKEKLANDVSALEGKVVTLKLECDKLLHLNESLEENISFTENKLANMLESYNQQFCHLDISPNTILENGDKKDVIFQLQQVQQDACLKNCQLLKESQALKSERDSADASLAAFRSEFWAMKQLFQRKSQDMLMRLDLSDALVEQFQVKLESVAEKLQLSSELEKEYIEQNENLLADLAHTQGQLQELICEKGYIDLAHSGVVALEQELQRSKQTVIELMDNNQELDLLLLNKTEESVKLSGEVSCLKEKLKSTLDDLQAEKGLRIELERSARDLDSELNEYRDKFLISIQQNDELKHVRQLVSDLEAAKSRLAHIVSQQNEELETSKSYRDNLEGWLLELLDQALATDVTHVYIENQYEAHHLELNQKLCHSEVCLSAVQKKYNDTKAMLRRYEASGASENTETRFLLDCNLSAVNLESPRSRMKDAEEQILSFAVLNEELEIVVMILKEKLNEAYATWTKVYEDELTELRTRCNELSSKLSDQVLKTEEFKNLSIHLREVNEKAEVDYLVARKKTETEEPAVSGQDTLRVAFMKEQYETRIQELKQQLAISKKHGEEMLLKLQDAIDELENTKRSEALSLKRNEELCLRLANLDDTLQSTITEKREKVKAYDRMKAELECALLSLECCKAEREKLEASVLDFEVANSQLTLELSSMKQKLDDLKSPVKLDNNDVVSQTEMEQDASSIGGGDTIQATENVQLHDFESVARLAQSNGRDPDVVVEDPGVQRLKSCFEHLYEELERMKNQNADESVDLDADDPHCDVPETEIAQLNRANELLRSLFPLPDGISVSGNPLEKILSFEIELIEALKAKSKQNLQTQSDEEDIVKSFRDINELINKFLQLKCKHGSMEADLREMHQRYSQLSLRFAEVEGERQKLEMTLKTLRATRKIVALKRASTANAAGNLS